MSASVEELVQQVRALPRDELQRFRALLDEPPEDNQPPASEEDFLQHLLDIGMISEIKRPSKEFIEAPRRRYDIEGEPLSVTVIRERE